MSQAGKEKSIREGRIVPLKDTLGNPVTLGKVGGISPRDYLQAGEDYIREHGWMKRDWDNPNGEACSLGGIYRGANGVATRLKQPTHITKNVRAATKALYDSIPLKQREKAEEIAQRDVLMWTWGNDNDRIEYVVSSYNDLPETTQEDIFTMFAKAKEIASPTPLELTEEERDKVVHVDPDAAEEYLRQLQPV